jgi:4-hydroxybenzoate polyprenyltransferase
LPVVYGKSIAKMVAQAITLIMFGLIGYYQYMQVQDNSGGESQEEVRAQTRALITVMYFLFAVQLPLAYVIFQIYTAKLKEDYHKISSILKLIMLAGISYSALFYFLIIKL